ncbi:MAG: phospholipid carrier-dependent glycosyltransferase [SAR202 cluster bacterium]|nr:phospholipid carrier-dependent glycosyltransferase [SAR202 cluster bacterium]
MPTFPLDILIALFAVVAAWGVGRGILRRLPLGNTTWAEQAVLALGLGLALIVLLMMVLGFAGLYSQLQAWLMLAGLGLAGVVSQAKGDLAGVVSANGADAVWRRLRTAGWPFLLLAAVLLVYGIGYLAAALAPTLEGDSIAGYLLTAREYARQGGIVSVDYAYTNTYPANGQMLSTLGFLLRGQVLAQIMVVWVPGLLGAATVYALGRRWFSRRAALFAVVVWYGMYSVGYLAASGKIDLAWAAFDLLAILAFARWYFAREGERSWGWLVVAGLFLGIAGGTKQASLFTAVTMAMGIAFKLWRDGSFRPRAIVQSYLVIGLPAAVALVWVVRSYTLSDAGFFTGEELPGETGITGYFRVLWDMSMLGNTSSTEGPAGKPIGPSVLASVPLVLLLRDVDRRLWHILAFCGLMSAMWYFGVQRARHFLPTLGLLSLVAGYVVMSFLDRKPRLGQALVTLVAAALVLNLAVWAYINFVSIQRAPYILGMQTKDEYLAENLLEQGWYPNHTVTSYALGLPQDARIAGLSVGSGFYLERPLYTGWAQTPAEVPDAAAFYGLLRSSGITHVFINDFVVRQRHYEQAWLAQPPFQAEYLEQLVCDNGQCLYAVR